jgi:hypothetical protein
MRSQTELTPEATTTSETIFHELSVSRQHNAKVSMAEVNEEKLSQLPEEMLSFTLAGAAQRLAPRLGTLAIKGRTQIQTPNYIGNTSRGVLPHISQDNQRRHTRISGLYMGLEDCTCPSKLRSSKPALTRLLILKCSSHRETSTPSSSDIRTPSARQYLSPQIIPITRPGDGPRPRTKAPTSSRDAHNKLQHSVIDMHLRWVSLPTRC